MLSGCSVSGADRPCPCARCSTGAASPSRSSPTTSTRRRSGSSPPSRGLPIVVGHVGGRLPDVHLGIGATVGSVIATRRALIPGRGGRRHRLRHERLPAHARRRAAARLAAPGCARRSRRPSPSASRPTRSPSPSTACWPPCGPGSPASWPATSGSRRWSATCTRSGRGSSARSAAATTSSRSASTSRTGVWVMLHSGSRGVGNVLGRYFTQLAKRDIERRGVRLPAKESRLAGRRLGTLRRLRRRPDLGAALRAGEPPAHDGAHPGRAARAAAAVPGDGPAAVECHHNYVAEEEHFGEPVYVTRKGAIRAGRGELGIIPGSMGSRVVHRARDAGRRKRWSHAPTGPGGG